MKVYVVRVERDGRTVKAPGVSETEIKREDFLYAADSINRVWDAIEAIRMDPEAHLIGVWEQHPSIQVLNEAGGTTER
jgi:hypothetical protein